MTAPTITVEIAFSNGPLDAMLSWTDVTSYLVAINYIRRGRQHELDRIECGEAELVLKNLDRRFDPTYASGPYYPYVLPMRRIRISAVWSAVTYRLFTGFIEDWPPDWPLDGTANVTIHCVDGFKFFNLVKLNTTLSSEFSGWATASLMTEIGWPSGDTSASGGKTIIAGDTLSDTSALERLLAIVEAEQGLAFIRGDGVLEFQNRHYRLVQSVSTTSQATFGDGGGSELPYSELTPSYDDTWIWNEIRVTPDGGSTQTAEDTTSQDAYFRRTLVKSGLIIGDASGVGGSTPDAEAADMAAWLLWRYKEPALRFKSLTVAGATSSSLWTQMLNRTLSHRITVVKRPPGGGSALSAECFIEAVEHRIGRNNGEDWTTTWQLSPATSLSFFILDHTTLGRLDYNALAY